MTVYEGLTLGFVALGIIFIIIGFAFNRTKEVMNEEDAAMEDQAFRKQINLVNEKVLELNDYHTFVKEEIEGKHKELLFLYQMIGEKEKAIKDIQMEIERLKLDDEPDLIQPDVSAFTEATKKHQTGNRKIIALKDQGYDAKEIAQILNIGQGEVELVLNLFE